MNEVMSACGVLCSGCGAFQGKEKGLAHQKRTVEAWTRIYDRPEDPKDISCGGCLSSDEEVFHTSRTCTARLCCRSKGFTSCAECSEGSCPKLKRAQSVWDGVPEIGRTLTPQDYAEYAQPYCGHRERLAAARRTRR